MNDFEARLVQLLRRIDTKQLIRYQPEQRLGQPLYDALVRKVRSGELTANQTANALVLLKRLRAYASDETEVFDLVLDALGHRSKRVRNQAARLAVGLMRIHEWRPPYFSAPSRSLLQTALDTGIDAEIGARIRRLLAVDSPAR